MPTSPNRWLSDTKIGIIIAITFALLVIGVISHLVLSKPDKPNKEKLLKELTSRLMEGKFEELYEEASGFVHSNVSKEEFVRRVKIATTKLKAIDGNLNFQTDRDAEMALTDDDGSITIRAVQQLGEGDKFVTVLIYWNSKGEFFNLSVVPKSGTSKEYQVHGVSHNHLYIGERMIE